MTDNPTDSVVTDAMIEAGVRSIRAHSIGFGLDISSLDPDDLADFAHHVYRAMSQASPPPQDEVELQRIENVAWWLERNRADDEQLQLLAVDLREQVAALTASRMGGDDE